MATYQTSRKHKDGWMDGWTSQHHDMDTDGPWSTYHVSSIAFTDTHPCYVVLSRCQLNGPVSGCPVQSYSVLGFQFMLTHENGFSGRFITCQHSHVNRGTHTQSVYSWGCWVNVTRLQRCEGMGMGMGYHMFTLMRFALISG